MPAGIDFELLGGMAPILSWSTFAATCRSNAGLAAPNCRQQAILPAKKAPKTFAAVAMTGLVSAPRPYPNPHSASRITARKGKPVVALPAPEPAEEALRKLFGIVKYFNGCYGFIEPILDDELVRSMPLLLTEKEIFFHRNDVFEYGFLSSELLAECFAPGQRVIFELIPAYKGNMKAQAGNIRLCLDIGEDDGAEAAVSAGTGADE